MLSVKLCLLMTVFSLVLINYLYSSLSQFALLTQVPRISLQSFQCLLVPPLPPPQRVSQKSQHFFPVFCFIWVFVVFGGLCLFKHFLFLSILNLQLHQNRRIRTVVGDHKCICSHWAQTRIYRSKRPFLINLLFKQ